MSNKCPDCGKELDLSIYAKAIEDSTIIFEITMEDGCLLSAKALGKLILDAGKLLDATARDAGAPDMIHFVKSLDHSGNKFSVTFVSAIKPAKITEDSSPAPTSAPQPPAPPRQDPLG